MYLSMQSTLRKFGQTKPSFGFNQIFRNVGVKFVKRPAPNVLSAHRADVAFAPSFYRYKISNDMRSGQFVSSAVSLQTSRLSPHTVRQTYNFLTDPNHELTQIENGTGIFEPLVNSLSSNSINCACEQSKTLNILRNRLFTSLHHLNFVSVFNVKNQPKYEYMNSEYPYELVYQTPFPLNPSIDTLKEIQNFVERLTKFSKAIGDIELARECEKLEGLVCSNGHSAACCEKFIIIF